MAVNPLIPLQSNVVIDPSRGISNLAGSIQRSNERERQSRLDERQSNQDAEEQKVRDLQLQKITSEIAKQGRGESVDQMTSAFIRIDEQIKAGNLEGARQTALSHKSSITELQKTNPSINSKTTDQFLNLLPNDPTAAAELITTERGILESIRDFSKSIVTGAPKSFAPVTLKNPTTSEKMLVSPIVDANSGLATLSEFEIPEGFEISTETPEEKRIADTLAENTRKIADLEADQKFKPRTAAQIELAKAATAKADKAFIQIDKIRTNIFNLRSARQAVLDGAGTGPIERLLPSFRAASVALDAAQGRLGLDVVQSTTFGALSKGELDLSKAIALPTGLEGDDLVKWIDDKISAQENVAAYLERQAVFLSETNEEGDPNTLADWSKKEKAIIDNILKSQEITEEDIQETIRTNPDMNDRSDVLRELRRRFESGGA